MQNRRQRLDLPFIRRRKDPVTWIYDHRAGVFSLVGLALVMAILFIGSKIVIRTPRPDGAIVVDVRTVEEMRRQAQRLENENRMLQSEADINHIRSSASNEGAELRDDRGGNTASMRDQLSEANDRMRGNRDAWDRGLREIESMRGTEDADGKKNATTTSRLAGTVQIRYSLIDPLRNAVDLYYPGYRCERGGEVTVTITVTRGGDVVATAVDRTVSTDDTCMHETALDAARRSRFDVNSSAPQRQTGTITYIFIPQ